MRLSGSLIRERARPVGLCLVVVATWMVLDRTVSTQAPAPAPPAAGTAAPQAPQAAAAAVAANCLRSRRKRSRSCGRRWIV
jgi:hypothetical protein